MEALEDRTLPAVTVPQLYVADVYNTEFARSGSDTEIAVGAGELLPGFTATDVAKLILSTPGFQTVEIRQLYERLAGVEPGSDAIVFWKDFLSAPGNTIDAMRVDFLSSDIYFNRVGGTNTAFVSALFGDVWSQPVDAGLLNQFVGELNNGASRSAIATAFVTDPRGYQAQIVADYDKVLDHDPDATSLSFFTGFRQGGGTNEQILAQLHGSSELIKHMQFFLNPPTPQTPFSDPNIAATTFRAQLKTQIADQLAAQMTAVAAAMQAQKDAANAAKDELDAAQQVQKAISDPTAATKAQNDANDALTVQDSDAKKQVGIAQTAENSAEPTATTMQAVIDAIAAEAAASKSAVQAQKDANEAKMAADAAKNCGMSTDLPSYLMCLDMTAAAAAADAHQLKGSADTLAAAAADDAATEPPPTTDDDTVTPDTTHAQDIADDAFAAVNAAPKYADNSQPAQLIGAAMASAQGAQSAASAAAGFAHDADTDRKTVGDKDMAAHAASVATHSAVQNALSELTQIENFNFLSDPFGFFVLYNNFFADYATAISVEAMAVQADTDAQAYLSNPLNDPKISSNVLSDKNKADGQVGFAKAALAQAISDISKADQAYQAEKNTGGGGTGNSGDGSDNGGSGRGGQDQYGNHD